jgi:hypothetical protein
MVVASLALLVALGGTSIAAINNVPLFSVGTPQLKSNAVTSPKVKNRSLLAVDFKQGQLPRGPRGLRGPAGPAGPSGPAGPAGAAAPGYVAQVTSQTSSSASTTTSTAYADLAGSAQTITVPAGEQARVYVLFTAESRCTGGGALQYCGVRILVDGNELTPAVGGDFAFDSNENGTANAGYLASHALARVSDELAAGNHQVKVQIRTTSAATTFRVDDWALVIFRTKIS